VLMCKNIKLFVLRIILISQGSIPMFALCSSTFIIIMFFIQFCGNLGKCNTIIAQCFLCFDFELVVWLTIIKTNGHIKLNLIVNITLDNQTINMTYTMTNILLL
jgi:hypothetical protein